MSVNIREVRLADDIQIKDLPCRIARKELLAPDVMALYLQLPAIEAFHYLPGQYLDIMLAGGTATQLFDREPAARQPPARASRPTRGGRRVHAAGVRGYRGTIVTANRRTTRPVWLRLRSGHDAKTPALLIGGGTGFAPLKSIIRHVLEKGLSRSLHLFWGARALADLYQHDLVQQWTKAHPTLRYTPVLSDLEADDSWQGRRGLVHESVFDAYPDLSGVEIYTSGPPALVEAIKSGAQQRGLPPERLHFDLLRVRPGCAREDA